MSQVEKMTVHRALAELKTLDNRIAKAIDESTLIMGCKKSATKINGMKVADFRASMVSDLQRIEDLCNRRNAMKTAVTDSNAVTKVHINGKDYTVAAAIDMKNHGLTNKQILLNSMRRQYNSAVREFNNYSGETIEKRAEEFALATLGATAKDAKNNADVTAAIESLKKSFIESHEYELIDPNGIGDRIKALTKEIEDFEVEVDAVLSESNATTMIEFEI